MGHWTMTVTNGAMVALMNDPCNEIRNMRHKTNPSVKIVVTSGPKIWPEAVKTWSIKEDPEDAKKRVWLSSAGDTLWKVPEADEIATFEEREMPEDWTDVKAVMQRIEGGSERDWRVFRHGVSTEEAKRFTEEDERSEGDTQLLAPCGAEQGQNPTKPQEPPIMSKDDGGRVIGFYGHTDGRPYREFSNFYLHSQGYEFRLPACVLREGFPTSIWCVFAEKAIMATKAVLMGDKDIWKDIEAAEDPAAVKKLGRRVKNFNEQLWQYHLDEIAFEVVKQKFAADATCRKILMSTGEATLAETAPNDPIWGIGLATTDGRVQDPSKWKGRNVLGQALMRARDHFRCSASSGIDRIAPNTPEESKYAEVRPFETNDCADCQSQVDNEEVRWYKNRPYCYDCYSSYFDDKVDHMYSRKVDINMMRASSLGGV